ncbi:MAG: hypothetical protein HOF33_18870 [Rhodospirillaceae bacterium]|nr:hypothetical protein [Rhodospirillaceae bacterium]
MTARSTIRSRQCRTRQRKGAIRIGVDIPREVVWRAIECGLITEDGAQDKKALGRFATRLLDAWGQGALPT